MPTVALSLAHTMALDLTYFATRHANMKILELASVGHALRDHAQLLRAETEATSRVCTSRPPATLLYSKSWETGARRSPTSQHRTSLLTASSDLCLARHARGENDLDELPLENGPRGARR